MGGGYLGNAGTFLVDFLFQLFILAVLVRLLLQIVRADFYNPVSQALVKITNPPLRPLRRLIPGMWGIDLASVVLLLILAGVKLFLLGMIRGLMIKPAGLLLLSVAELLQLTVYVFLFTIFIRVVLSWFGPHHGYNPVTSLLANLTDPLMRPARRLLPPISGLDLSPMAVFVFLYLLLILIVQPLLDFGRFLSL